MMVQPWLERAAATRGDVAAVVSDAGTLTYAELLERAAAGAEGLGGAERAALALPPGEDFAVALHAVLLAGAAAVPVDARLTPSEQAAQAGRADLVIDRPLPRGRPSRAAGGAQDVRRSPAPAADTPALIVHTSGTTGAPQPVTLTHGNVLANAVGCAFALGHARDERWLCPLPLTHVGGLMTLMRSAIAGTTVVLGGLERIADATVASLVPTQLGRLLAAGTPAPPALRVVMLGGAPADPTLLGRARDAGWPVAPTYGLTQACSAVTVAEPGDLTSSGAPILGASVRIDDATGEIVVAGPSVSGGGGPLRTGDLGRIDDGGRLHVIGRAGDTIVTGGENVQPTEVEAALLAHPSVAEAGVFGAPDPEWGEAITAAVVLRSPAEPDALRAFAATRLAGFKVPKVVLVRDAPLPRNAAGKLLRRELRG